MPMPSTRTDSISLRDCDVLRRERKLAAIGHRIAGVHREVDECSTSVECRESFGFGFACGQNGYSEKLAIAPRLAKQVGVPAVVGPSGSTSTSAVYESLVGTNTLIISPSARSATRTTLDTTNATDENPGLLWRTAPSDSAQGLRKLSCLSDGATQPCNGTPLGVISSNWVTISENFRSGTAVKVKDASGELYFDLAPEETLADIEVWVVGSDGKVRR